MRVAIVGAGLMGRWHAYYARQCGASIVGIADSVRPEAELRRGFRGAAVFQETGPMLRELKPDVVHVCTPAATHEQIVETALAAGVHLLVEKPLALTAQITARLLAKAAERELLLAPVHQYVFQDGVMRATGLLRETIGRPLHFDATICSAGGANMSEPELDDLAGEILPHPLSLLDALFPGTLPAVDWIHVRSGSGEWRIVGAAVERELSISILVSLRGRPTQSSLRLTGTNGTIHVDLFHGFAVLEPGGVSRARKIAHPFSLAARTFRAAGWNLARRLVHREPAYPGLRRLIRLFYDAVRQCASAPLSGDHVVTVARVRDQLIVAASPTNQPRADRVRHFLRT